MQQSILTYVFPQIVAQSPMLVVALAGMVLAIVLRPRCPRACTLVLAGSAVHAVTIVVQAVATGVVMGMQARGDLGIQELTTLMAVSGIAGGVLRGAGMGLVLAAVFVGRTPAMAASGTPPTLAR